MVASAFERWAKTDEAKKYMSKREMAEKFATKLAYELSQANKKIVELTDALCTKAEYPQPLQYEAVQLVRSLKDEMHCRYGNTVRSEDLLQQAERFLGKYGTHGIK